MKTTTPGRSTLSPTTRFDALEVAYELIRALRPIVAKLKQTDPKEAAQLKDAASSIARNLSEGNRRTGRDRVHFFNIAAGSADEVRGSLRNSVSWGDLGAAEVAESLALADRELAILWRLTHRRC